MIGARMLFTDLFAAVLVMYEAHVYGYHISQTSEEAEDKKLAKDLYDWTVKELTAREFIKA
eukprot:CAMPEP_0202972808 /NCGR_PEP_ID=MMETSP1396-20130829/41887_1 /ASSEMBLY_ACC=CAM_ASM_000872 /TAXON_ID= /ORGANISM="Pseudokeronopsis sp., Strain Brazil" /LENGTH=60 /DNA_ID=CAMNT_0049703783 /DNA_START=11 /DNA_END=193 /DNA_ORIENTATION=-